MSLEQPAAPLTAIPVPSSVASDILLVRDTDLVNMLDVDLVVAALSALGMDETVSWIGANRGRYVAAVIFGMHSGPAA